MNTYIMIALVSSLLSGATCFGVAWEWQSNKYAAKDAERIAKEAEVKDEQVATANVSSTDHEKAKVEIRTKFITVTETVEKIIEKPIYRADCFDADGLREHAEAVKLTGNTSEPSYRMPAASVPQ